jgi:CBS domain containing-hemolysin-like protein
MSSLALLGAIALFLVGLRLSAFFSGAEIGFYRLNFLRLNIDAQQGDRVSRKLVWFVRNPSSFVATTLIGNNIANYLTTLAIGWGMIVLLGESAGAAEIVGTLIFSPIIFLFGELIPKNLYHRAPMYFLRKDLKWFVFCYRLLLIFSIPLVKLTKLIEKLSHADQHPAEFVLGRKRLVKVLGEGQQEGLLTEQQSRLINGLLDTASQPVIDSMTPTARILGVVENTPTDQILKFARKYGLTSIPVKTTASETGWFGYVRVANLAIEQKPLDQLLCNMPAIPQSASKLEALLILRNAGVSYGLIKEDDQILGMVSERGLAEQLFRPARPLGAKATEIIGNTNDE